MAAAGDPRGARARRRAAVFALCGSALFVFAARLPSPAPAAEVGRGRPGAPSAPAPRPPRRALESRFTWPRTAPEAQGIDGAVMAGYRARIAAGEFGPVHSFLLVRHGALVEESYLLGWEADDLHPTYSVTKSVTSLLFGIGRGRGLLPALDAGVLPLFPAYPTVANLTPAKRRITVEDLLTMRAGLEWNELAVSYLDPANDVLRMFASADWPKFVLDRPMREEPGTRFRYNTGASVLLGGVLRGATGRQPAALGRDWLFAPLEITSWRWDAGRPDLLTNTGSGLHLRPLDMAKLGLLILQRGWWRGLPVVPADWIDAMRAIHAPVNPDFAYGYQGWVMPLRPGSPWTDEADQIWLAWGYGGQFIFVVPGLDLVAVSTAGCVDESCEGAVEFIQALLAEAVVDWPSGGAGRAGAGPV